MAPEPRARRRGPDTGALVVGGLLVLGGLYLLARDTFHIELPRIDWDQVWPVILIVIGGVIVLNAWRRREA